MAKQKKSFIKKWWFWGIVILVVIAVAQGGEGDQNQAGSETEESQAEAADTTNEEIEEETQADPVSAETYDEEASGEETAAETTEAAEKPADDQVEITSGMYEVGSEIEPGLYKTTGSVNYWERLSGFSGEFDDIIANNNPRGQDYVQIKDTDTAFSTQGTGSWILIDDSYNPEPQASFDDGAYLVGKDIEPGKYKSTSGGGYWARLSGFGGDFDHIISNDNPSGQTIVEIQASDKGFQSWGNGEWTKVE